MHRLLCYLSLFLYISHCFAGGDIINLSKKEGQYYCDQEIKFSPPICHNNKCIEKAVIRSAILVAFRPDGSNLHIADKAVVIFVGDQPGENLAEAYGTTDPGDAICQIPALSCYNHQNVTDNSDRLIEMFKCIEKNNPSQFAGMHAVIGTYSNRASKQ